MESVSSAKQYFRGNTHFTLHDTVSKEASFRVDMRIISDRIRQRYNLESDVGVMEASEEDANDSKYTADRVKVSIEIKTIIDKFLVDGVNISSVDALQICGLQIFFLNTFLEKGGVYITTEHYKQHITKSLNNVKSYVDLALQLLCFRDKCIQINNKYDDKRVEQQSNKSNRKRPATTGANDILTGL